MNKKPLIYAYDMLQKAIEDLERGRIDNAMTSIIEVRRSLIESLPATLLDSSRFDALRKVFYLSECLMLHFQALAQREQEKENGALHLAYLGQALGINTMLESSLVPLMLRYAEDDQGIKEIAQFSKQNRFIKDDLCKSTSYVVSKIQGQLKGRIKESLDLSITKIINAVNPNSEIIRSLAIKLSIRFEAGDFKQARRIYEFVRDEVQYIFDPLEFEEIQSPETTLKLRAGDCEDQAILLCSLLSAIGFQSALIFADTNNDGVADHVYSAVYIPRAPDYSKPLPRKKLQDSKDLNDWIPLDPASQDSDFGVIPLGDFQIMKFAPVNQ